MKTLPCFVRISSGNKGNRLPRPHHPANPHPHYHSNVFKILHVLIFLAGSKVQVPFPLYSLSVQVSILRSFADRFSFNNIIVSTFYDFIHFHDYIQFL